MPFHEPGLAELLDLSANRMVLTDAFSDGVVNADVVFIAAGTPSLPNGNPDLCSARSTAEQAGRHMQNHFTVVLNKSPVPIGSASSVESVIRTSFEDRQRTRANGRFSVVPNPEFLRDSAIRDTLYSDRIVICNPKASEVVQALYHPILEQSFLAPEFTPRAEGFTAELITYAAKAFLSLTISFANEGQLAEGQA